MHKAGRVHYRVIFFVSASTLSLLGTAGCSEEKAKSSEESSLEAVSERIKPVGKVNVVAATKEATQAEKSAAFAFREELQPQGTEPRWEEDAAPQPDVREGQHRHRGPEAARERPWGGDVTPPDRVRRGQHQRGGLRADRQQPWEEDTALEKIIVQPGDTLYGIARRVYGEAGLWRLIYDANRDRLEDPNQVPAGIELVIPAR